MPKDQQSIDPELAGQFAECFRNLKEDDMPPYFDELIVNSALQPGQIEIKAYPDDKNEIAFNIFAWEIGIDWGDGNFENSTYGKFRHKYPTRNLQTIKIDTIGLSQFNWNHSHCSVTTFRELSFGICPKLKNINCSRVDLTSLSLSKCATLDWLDCCSNRLSFLDVSKCADLVFLNCWSNHLTSLDISKCKALNNLSCGRNALTSVDVSKCTALIRFKCQENEITSLDVSTCTVLTELVCNNNQLSTSELNSLFNSLPERKPNDGAIINFRDNPGSDTCDKTIATKKGWAIN